MINSKETGIYKITNLINNKIYIGSSSSKKDGFSDRIRTHIRLLNRETHYNKHLQSSWLKHGSENFIFEIVEIILDVDKIIEREQFYIDKLNCCDRNIGYNKSKIAGSQLGFKHSAETKKKLSNSWYKNEINNRIHIEKLRLFNIGKSQSIESNEKRRKASLGVKCSDETKEKLRKIFKGRVISEETRIKISNTKKGTISLKRLEVYQLDLDGNEIRKWDFCGDAEKELGIPRGKISAVCLGHRKQTGGYKWKYV